MGDERGKLVAIESSINIPFEIKRIFHIYATLPDISRGRHAHYKTKQYLIAVNGSCQVTLDDGTKKETFVLDRPDLGLFQNSMIWGTMHSFSTDCVLLVLASEKYNDDDYIRSYEDFKKILTS